jgi:1-acylglycerone phosphate reductase
MSTQDPAQIYILITGISPGGLGDALTTELLKHPNTHILATGLSLTHLSHLPLSPRISKLPLDVTSPTSISTALVTTTTITSGRLDYLINNAGYGYMMPLLDADTQSVNKNFDVNVFGLLAVTQAFFPLLREGKGTVVNQCSIASLAGGRQPFIGSYCATKAAVASLNDTMRVEFEPLGVKVGLIECSRESGCLFDR